MSRNALSIPKNSYEGDSTEAAYRLIFREAVGWRSLIHYTVYWFSFLCIFENKIGSTQSHIHFSIFCRSDKKYSDWKITEKCLTYQEKVKCKADSSLIVSQCLTDMHGRERVSPSFPLPSETERRLGTSQKYKACFTAPGKMRDDTIYYQYEDRRI